MRFGVEMTTGMVVKGNYHHLALVVINSGRF